MSGQAKTSTAEPFSHAQDGVFKRGNAMGRSKTRPMPPQKAPVTAGEFGGWAGEKEVALIWNVYDAKNEIYRPNAWQSRLPEYLGMLRFFSSMGSPVELLNKAFQMANEYTPGGLKARSPSYLRDLQTSLESFDSQEFQPRHHTKSIAGTKNRRKVPTPTTLFQLYRALSFLRIPRPKVVVFSIRKKILGHLPEHYRSKEYLLTRKRVPVEDVEIVPCWKDAEEFNEAR